MRSAESARLREIEHAGAAEAGAEEHGQVAAAASVAPIAQENRIAPLVDVIYRVSGSNSSSATMGGATMGGVAAGASSSARVSCAESRSRR